MFVLAERLNPADAPELKILSADFDGQLDLSPALLHQIPRGTIVGKYSARGEKNSIMDGYKNGSPCVQRSIMPIPQTEIGGAGFRTTEPLWRHNESTMRLIASGASRQFLYEAPRDGLREVGVTKGTLLFKGRKDGNSYSGTAYVFTRCGSLPYAVSGPVSADHRKVTMQGRMPIPGSGCSSAGYRDDTLMFTFLGD
jgi:hypothetical protein